MMRKEPMPGASKALKIIKYAALQNITPKDYKELADLVRTSETTHGLLWGDIAKFGQETKTLDMLKLCVDVLQMVRKWPSHPQHSLALRAALLAEFQLTDIEDV